MSQNIEYIRLPEVRRITGLGTTSIYTMASRGDFPKQVKLGPRCVAWIRSEVQAWAQSRANMRQAV